MNASAPNLDNQEYMIDAVSELDLTSSGRGKMTFEQAMKIENGYESMNREQRRRFDKRMRKAGKRK